MRYTFRIDGREGRTENEYQKKRHRTGIKEGEQKQKEGGKEK